MGNERFLLEMTTGTGKTLISSALIKMFLRLYNVKRVLFLVDRIELETQEQKEFHEVLRNDSRTVIWKANQFNWQNSEIVVSTVQSFVTKNKYKRIFRPDDFDLVILLREEQRSVRQTINNKRKYDTRNKLRNQA